MGEVCGTWGGCGREGDFGGREGFFVFGFFLGGRPCGWAGFCVGVCEEGGSPPGVRVVWR